ncbi:MAG: hypothetical protein WKF77_32510 [Planctomycetaceae bacterium]
MIAQHSTSEPSSKLSRWALLHDDSVRLFDAGRTLLGAFITACLFLAAHLWL